MKPKHRNDKGAPLLHKYQSTLRRLVERLGERGAVDRLGLSRQTIARAASGLNLQRASRELLFAKLDSEGER